VSVPASPPRLLITGAAGRLGSAVRRRLGARYPCLRLTDIRPIPAWAGRLESLTLHDALADARQGGTYVRDEFTADPARLP